MGVPLIFPFLVSPKLLKDRENYKINTRCHGDFYHPAIHHPLYNLSLCLVCVFQASSSILTRSKGLRLGRAHIGFRDNLIGQGDLTAVDTIEITYGATAERDAGDAEGVG